MGVGGHGKGRVPLPVIQHARVLLAWWFQQLPNLGGCLILASTSSPFWREQLGCVDRQHEHHLRHTGSCRGTARLFTQVHRATQIVTSNVPIRQVAIQARGTLPFCLRCTSSWRGVRVCSSRSARASSCRGVRFTSACCQLCRLSVGCACCTHARRMAVHAAPAPGVAHTSPAPFARMRPAPAISSLTASLRYDGARALTRIHSWLCSCTPSSKRRWPATNSCRWQSSSCLSVSLRPCCSHIMLNTLLRTCARRGVHCISAGCELCSSRCGGARSTGTRHGVHLSAVQA